MSNLTLLAVDDNADSLELLNVILNDLGKFNVLTATSASEAWQIVTQVKPDVLISDIVMPVEDGFSLIQKVRNHKNDKINKMSAIAVTALADNESVNLARHYGFDKLIFKPFDFHYLIDNINMITQNYKLSTTPFH